MKHFPFSAWLCAILLVVCATACNNNYEAAPDTEIRIREAFVPVSVSYAADDTAARELYREWNNKTVVVNSADDLPVDDPLGLPEYFRRINYADQTLLIHYGTRVYDVLSHTDRFILNNTEHRYEWIISLGITGLPDGDVTELTFTRYAILVPRLPAGAELSVWFGLTDHDWVWDD